MNKKSIPFITVIMAVYNGERWLEESLRSVLDQTFTDFEFIIVNDGSKDSSSDIINRFAKNDDRICVYTKDNSGLTDSLNYGLSKARGEWVARIDADDVCHLERFQKQVNLVTLNEDLVLVGTGLVIVDENGSKSDIHLCPDQHSNLKHRLISGSPFFAHSSAFFKLSVVQKLGGYRIQFKRSQDQDLWLRLVEVGQISCVKEPLVMIRKHDDQISHDESGQRQFVYSHMAMTSYFLRLKNKFDPMELGKTEDLEKFYAFILKSLKDEAFFEYQAFIGELKVRMSKADTIFSKLNALVVQALYKPKFVFRFFKYRLLGSNLPEKFAQKWVNII